MKRLVKLLLIIAFSPRQAVLNTARSIDNSGDVRVGITGSVALRPTPTTVTTLLTSGTYHATASSHTPFNTTITCTLACEKRPLPSDTIVSLQRSTFNSSFMPVPANPTARGDPNPNPTDSSESEDSRSLSIIFFAISALLTLATIAVAVVFGVGAARATQRLLNALLTDMRGGSHTLDVEMGNWSSSNPSLSDDANVDQTSDYFSAASK
jgi:hypothetical protein